MPVRDGIRLDAGGGECVSGEGDGEEWKELLHVKAFLNREERGGRKVFLTAEDAECTEVFEICGDLCTGATPRRHG